MREAIEAASVAVTQGDLQRLVQLLPPRVHWRLYGLFAEEALFLDVEAEDGRPPSVTVIGLYSQLHGPEVFVRGVNLESLPEALRRHRLWITFNGTTFDVPALRRLLGASYPRPSLHLDLRLLTSRIGRSMGLKRLEAHCGLQRPADVAEVTGRDATALWEEFVRNGIAEPLRRLIHYNLYDAMHLRALMDLTCNELVGGLGAKARPSFKLRGPRKPRMRRYASWPTSTQRVGAACTPASSRSGSAINSLKRSSRRSVPSSATPRSSSTVSQKASPVLRGSVGRSV